MCELQGIIDEPNQGTSIFQSSYSVVPRSDFPISSYLFEHIFINNTRVCGIGKILLPIWVDPTHTPIMGFVLDSDPYITL